MNRILSLFLVLTVGAVCRGQELRQQNGQDGGRHTAVAALQQTCQDVRQEIAADLNKAGGVYYAYPVIESLNTTPPKGYKPFYISHFGRHGSRYLLNDTDYSDVLDVLDKAHNAGALSELGEDVRGRVRRVWEDAYGRGGDLSPLGQKQHNDIARRMYKAYPQVFVPDARITAHSTTVLRCSLSMSAFCEGLKEQQPGLFIPRESSRRQMYYMNYRTPAANRYNGNDGPWRVEYDKFRDANTHPDRLIDTLFADREYARRFVDGGDLMWGLYWLAVGQQNIDAPVSFYDIFTPAELFDLWQTFNYHMYIRCGNYKGNAGLMTDCTKPLLRNIVETAEQYVDSCTTGATLRFGHDSTIIPLAAVMRLDGCYASKLRPDSVCRVFNDFRISPMAANVQLIFFRNKANDVIVKIMLNEREVGIPVPTDMFPFYRWEDVRDYYRKILDAPDNPFPAHPYAIKAE